MSTLTYYEPRKFSAGALALVVHAVFFSLLYFSFNWHVKTPPSMEVEMWDHLPDTIQEVVPVATPVPLPAPPASEPLPPPPKVEPSIPKNADIELKEKAHKKKKAVPTPKEPVAKAPAKVDTKAQKEAEKQRARAAQIEQQKFAAQQKLDKKRAEEARTALENERIQALKDKMRSDIDAENRDEVARYTDQIRAKISRNIVMPPDVKDNAEAEFMVTVLPGGSVMNDGVKLLKSSGNAAYDSAAERAIYKAQPLPLPQDATLARMFRELHLTVKP